MDDEWTALAQGASRADDLAARPGAGRLARSRGTPRELFIPLEGVPLNVLELMTLFAPCFYQVSGVHDPMGGTEEELESCARQLDREVTPVPRTGCYRWRSMGSDRLTF